MRLKQRSSVLLPQPDGPISAVILLRGMSIVMSLSASAAPYQTESPRVASTMGCSAPGRRSGRSKAMEPDRPESRVTLMSRYVADVEGVCVASVTRITPEAVANQDGGGVHREQEHQQDQIPPAATVWNIRVRLLGVVVDLDRQRRVAVERALGQLRIEPGGAHHEQRGGLADGPRQAEDRAGHDPRQRRGQDVVADHLPAGRSQRQRRLAERARDGPQRLLGRDHDDRQDQQAQRQRTGQRASGPAPVALKPNARTNSARPRMP